MKSSNPNHLLVKSLQLLWFAMPALSVFSQPKILGSLCITPGTEYTYRVTGEKIERLPFTVCITGGVFAGTTETCRKGIAEGFTVLWQDGTEKASLMLSSVEGDTTIYISKTTDLAGGEIAGLKKRQLVATNKEAFTLLCSPAKGSIVTGQYSYQWQSSENCIVWKNISGARDENLTAFAPPGQTTFFRRMVLEKIANTVMYSDVVTVFVVPAEIRPIDY